MKRVTNIFFYKRALYFVELSKKKRFYASQHTWLFGREYRATLMHNFLEAGLIMDAIKPKDKRIKTYQLTDKGRQIVEQLRPLLVLLGEKNEQTWSRRNW